MKVFLSSFLVIILTVSSSAQNADIDMLNKINSTVTKADNFYIGLSHSAAPVSMGMPVAFFTIGTIKKDKLLKVRSYEQAGAIVLSSVVSLGLKYGIDRQRPYDKYPFINRKINEHTPSFPSGHTTSAFTAATIITLQYPKWYVAVPAYAWAIGVSYSRMHLGVHYPTDLLGGIILGAGSSFLVNKISKRIQKHKEKKNIPQNI